ncbi:MAG: ATP-binding protein [Bacteroidota bacterium]
MPKLSLAAWFRNIPISKKLYFTVGIMAALIVVELGALTFSVNILSSVRAYVGGEGLWSKAQKDGMYQLLKYGRNHNEEDYRKFQEFMQVSLGDHRVLVELQKEKPDLDIARQGFLQGRNHPDDLDGMIQLFIRFKKVYYINKAMVAWAKADSLVTTLSPIGAALHEEIGSPAVSQKKIDEIVQRLDPINTRLTILEDEFSYTLGEGSRWLEKLVLRLLFVIALTVELTGLLLAIFVSRNIQRGLKEILASSQAVTIGDFTKKAKIFSKDEIGVLANNFNTMAAALEQATIGLERQVQQRTQELQGKNRELEQFAYVASHDLQEPLRTTTGFVHLFRKQYYGKIDATSDKYLDYIVQSSERMKMLIKDLLDYSRLGQEKELQLTNCNRILDEVLADLQKIIHETNAEIHTETLPVLQVYPTEFKLLLQNLITNAIKFRKHGEPPRIHIGADNLDGYWKFSVTDNGIGIEKMNQERVFSLFQRLHSRTEYEGSGIGLAHCQKIIEMHRGRIYIQSEFGKGSIFIFTLFEN